MKKIVTLLMITIFILSGCESIEMPTQPALPTESLAKPNTENTQPVSTPHFGSDLNISMRTPKTLNPLLNEDETVDTVLKLIFEQIVALDENQRPTNNLCNSIHFSDDGYSAVVSLRSDVFWADGTQMTADDMIFSYSIIKGSLNGSIYKSIQKEITEMLKVDNYTVKITFSGPQGGMAYSLMFPVIPQHYYRNQNDPASAVNMAPLGNGPYQFVSILPVKQMELTASNTTFRQKPLIQKINVLITDDDQTDLQAFDQGVIDVVVSNMMGFGKYSGTVNMATTELGTNYYDFIGFNFRNVVFEDKRIREAIARCVNVDELIERVYLGHAIKTLTVANPHSWAYEATAKESGFDMDKAKNLIYQAGFKDNNLDGILDREIAGVNFELKFKLLVNEESEERTQIAEILAENLTNLGVLVELDVCDFETYTEKLKSGNFDIFLGAYNFSVRPDFMFAFHSTKMDVGSNYGRYRSATLDGYLLAASIAANEAEYQKALSSIQKHIADELPCVSLVFRQKAVLTDSRVGGDKKPVLNNIYANINEWRIE